jgi:hypothetical protein
MPVLRRNCNDCLGSKASDRPARDVLGMSASLRSRPNLRTQRFDAMCHNPTFRGLSMHCGVGYSPLTAICHFE